MRRSLCYLALCLTAGCAERSSPHPEPTAPAPAVAPPSASGAHASAPLTGLNTAALDPEVSACDDLYRHACGGYLATARVPPGRRWIDLAGDAISDRRRALSREALAKTEAPRAAAARCQDEAHIERAGVTPLTSLLKLISQATDRAGLSRALAALHSHGIDALFSLRRIDRGLVAPRAAVASPQSPGGSLRLSPASTALEALAGDTEQLTAILTEALGWLHREARDSAPSSPLSAEVTGALSVERLLFDALSTAEDKRAQPKARGGAAPGLTAGAIDWSVYLTNSGLSDTVAHQLDLSAPGWQRAQRALAALPREALQSYLRFRLLLGAELALPREARRALRRLTLAPGETTERPRRDRCERWVERAFQDELGPAFAELALPSAAAAEVAQLAATIRAQATRHFTDQPSRLEEVIFQLGAGRVSRPEPKSAKLTNELSFGELWLAVMQEAHAESMRQLTAPVDRERMPVLVITPNLFYHPGLRAVVAPAGYLLPPNFIPGAPPEQNYARLGFGLAHELAHVFDARSGEPQAGGAALSDGAAAGQGASRACLAGLLEAEGALPEGPLAERRLNEVMADIAGIQVAYAALEAQLAPQREAERASARRRFWIHYAQSHCRQATEEGERWLAANAAHPPSALRVNLTARHVPTLARDLGCTVSAPLPACTWSDAP